MIITTWSRVEVERGSEHVAIPELGLNRTSRYIGAGIVTRAAGGKGPRFVLTSGSGKVLAHLYPDSSVNLEKRVGKSVGLHGKRFYDDKAGADRIEVSGLEEVKLR